MRLLRDYEGDKEDQPFGIRCFRERRPDSPQFRGWKECNPEDERDLSHILGVVPG